MEKFISTILTLILALWALKWVFALIAPWLMRLVAKRMMKKAGFSQHQDEDAARDDGGSKGRAETVKGDKWWKPDEVILKPHRREGQRLSDLLGGEYTDYQEIE